MTTYRYNARFTDKFNCKQCGEEFYATRRDVKYCSSRCRVAASRARKKKYKEIMKKNQLSLAL